MIGGGGGAPPIFKSIKYAPRISLRVRVAKDRVRATISGVSVFKIRFHECDP